ncbi:putative dienelactone hydrolase [Azospirillum fermentarium]|uniref:alpha/beta hydrolase family protein n=1 Tax=Azospirillum fermentarium TaxID=1233114 RepID=UPI002227B13E|nr:hypothetical protein [Azospirillum fermentarium]MCW2247330.1 putative dienelactone hydrolase [Azospirillum fermentarium]
MAAARMLVGLAAGLAWLVAAGTAVRAEEAPFNAGLREASYADPARGGRAGMLVWYPTAAEERTVRRGPFAMDVAERAEPAAGRFALVMISHGSGGTALAHRGLARYLARHGFVAVAPVHAGNTAGDDSTAGLNPAGTGALWRNRPAQFSAALDAVLADPVLGAMVNPGRVGAFGFSAGGYTVLAAASGRADLSGVRRYCETVPEDWGFCGHSPDQRAVGEGAVGRISRPPDTRIRAAVLAAPVGALFGPSELADLHIPVRLYRAGKDDVVGPVQVERVRALLTPPPDYETVEGAGHYAFMAPFPAFIAAEVGPPAHDPPGFDRPAFLARLNEEVTAFFRRTLAE